MANAEIILTSASVEVDDETLTIEGNTIVIIEGQGTSTVKAGVNGNSIVPIVSEDTTTKVGCIKFDVPASITSMNITRDIKARGSGRVVRVSGTDREGNTVSRTLTQGIMTNDPDKTIQNEGKISVEFHGAPLVPA